VGKRVPQYKVTAARPRSTMIWEIGTRGAKERASLVKKKYRTPVRVKKTLSGQRSKIGGEVFLGSDRHKIRKKNHPF